MSVLGIYIYRVSDAGGIGMLANLLNKSWVRLDVGGFANAICQLANSYITNGQLIIADNNN